MGEGFSSIGGILIQVIYKAAVVVVFFLGGGGGGRGERGLFDS